MLDPEDTGPMLEDVTGWVLGVDPLLEDVPCPVLLTEDPEFEGVLCEFAVTEAVG